MKTFDEIYGVCPYCGFIPGTPPKEAYHLYPGTVLNGRYVVGTTVGFGGFGITYRAWDRVLEKKVAIKEFYPNGIVNRVPGERDVIIYSGDRANEFRKGKLRFLAEARNMARFHTHPNIVNVYEFFEENNTAYIAMEFLEGMSYRDYIKACGGRVDVDTAVNVVLSVLDALKEIHKEKIIHRDVSPDNIFLVPAEPGTDGYRVKLIDFGAAGFSDGEEERSLSIILKPGYAPPEQYYSRSRQGPWTDIYAVGAVFYCSITGVRPEDSPNRLVEDHLKPPGELVEDLPQYLNDSILRAMALNQELRFQSVDQFREAIRQKVKVLSVDSELKRRKVIRGASVAAICAVLLGAAVGCRLVYVRKQNALYNITASVAVQMPDLNGERKAEIEAAGAVGAGAGGAKQLELEDSADMLDRMLREYEERFEKVRITEKTIADAADYQKKLLAQAAGGSLPDVFESTGITAADGEAWELLGTLDTTYETLDRDSYYFMDRKAFRESFAAEKKQIPVSFSAPVLYVNTHMVSDQKKLESLQGITSLKELSGEDKKPSYCVSNAYKKEYERAFAPVPGTAEFAAGSGSEKGYEPFLRREKAYYLGSTDDYEAVRASLGGIYRMVVPVTLWKEKKLKGTFTHLWSIDGSLEGEEKRAADSMVYYLMSETAQDVLNLQCGNGLSLNKKMLETYVKSNDEFQAVADSIRYLEMNFGEEPGT